MESAPDLHLRCFLLQPVQYNSLMIPQDFLDILVCPLCKIRLAVGENGESLKCPECRRIYPVRDDIPILLVDEAKIEVA